MKLDYVPITSILVTSRARKDLGNLDEIEETSQTYMGQIQTIAVCESLEPGKFDLLDGGRRLTALKSAGHEKIAVRIYPKELTLRERKSIELIGNVSRLDFSWAEEVALKKQIHDLQISIRQEEQKEDPSLPDWTEKDTAETLGVGESALDRDLKLADFVDKVPSAGEAKNKKEAMGLEDRLIEKLAKEELSRRIAVRAAETGIDKVREGLREAYALDDFFEVGQHEAIDDFYGFIELDPPYGTNIDVKRGDRNDAVESENREGFENWDRGNIDTYTKKLLETLSICYNKMKENAFIIVWYDITATGPLTLAAMREIGFTVDDVPAIWYKNAQTRNFNPTSRLGKKYEPFYYGYKGHPVLAKVGRDNVFEFARDVSSKRIHPTEKPRALLREIIQTFCQPGTNILSPFLGSGNIILSAYDVGCTCIGYDLGKGYKNSFDIRTTSWEPPKQEKKDENSI